MTTYQHNYAPPAQHSTTNGTFWTTTGNHFSLFVKLYFLINLEVIIILKILSKLDVNKLHKSNYNRGASLILLTFLKSFFI